MSLNSTSALHRKVAAVRRRLFVQSLIRAVAWAWFAALAASAVWFLAEPLLFATPPAWLRWVVLAGVVVIGTAAAVTFAVLRRASAVRAALALDEQFRLRERVTTSLLLRPDEAASPAGVALLADAEQRVGSLRVGERFPVRVPWTAALVPAAAVVLLLLVFFYHPDFSKAQDAAATQQARNAAMLAQIQPVQQQLRKQNEEHKKNPPKSEDLQRIEADIDRMLNNKHDTPESVQEDVKKGDAVLDKLNRQDQAAADAQRRLKEDLEQLQRQRGKDDQARRDDGPAKNLNQALDQGDLAQAQREAQKLADKIQDDDKKIHDLKDQLADPKNAQDPAKKQDLQNDLKGKEDQKAQDDKKLADQLKNLQDNANQLADKKDKDQKELADAAKQDGADKDANQRQQNELKQQQADLKDLANKLGQAQQATQQGKGDQAAQALKDAADKLGDLSKQGERDRIAQDMKQVQDLKQAMAQGLAKQDNPGGKPGDQGQQGKQGDQAGDQGKPGDQAGNQGKPGNQVVAGPNPQGQQGLGAGARPNGTDEGTGSKDQQVHSNPDDKGRQQVIGDQFGGPHEKFKGPERPDAMNPDDLRRWAQEGEDAAEHEKITDKGSADTEREWFQAIRPPEKPK